MTSPMLSNGAVRLETFHDDPDDYIHAGRSDNGLFPLSPMAWHVTGWGEEDERWRRVAPGSVL
jgi:hypothetical protein